MLKFECLTAAVICVLFVASIVLLAFNKEKCGMIVLAVAIISMIGYQSWFW
jgi:hypothetical protein